MTLTLLLDLDDTLLDSNMNAFIPVYFQTLGKAMSPHIAPQLLLEHLMVGTEAMIKHDSPHRTLEEVFEPNFYPHLGVERDIVDPKIDHFYSETFPTLSYLTKPRPEAVEFIKWAIAQGHRIAIATNPLFPKIAIYHRLRWAGLEPDEYPFEVISSFESFHFSKPNPAYLAEVLGLMGFPDGPVLMVGDDPVRDVIAAEELGIPMYWVADKDEKLPEERQPIAGQGSIGELRSWIEARDEETLMPWYQAQSAIVASIKSVPAVLDNLLGGISEEMWSRQIDPDEWCLNEVLGHLRDVEREVNLPRIQQFLKEDNPFIRAGNTDIWASERKYSEQNGEEALRDFIDIRMETLSLLGQLSEKDWLRSGRHAIFGPITLQEQLGFAAEHDRVHVRQIYDILKRV